MGGQKIGLVRLVSEETSAGKVINFVEMMRRSLMPLYNCLWRYRPFVLLTGTTIALILLVAGSIALLAAVGATTLPSTLTGAVAGGAKRE